MRERPSDFVQTFNVCAVMALIQHPQILGTQEQEDVELFRFCMKYMLNIIIQYVDIHTLKSAMLYYLSEEKYVLACLLQDFTDQSLPYLPDLDTVVDFNLSEQKKAALEEVKRTDDLGVLLLALASPASKAREHKKWPPEFLGEIKSTIAGYGLNRSKRTVDKIVDICKAAEKMAVEASRSAEVTKIPCIPGTSFFSWTAEVLKEIGQTQEVEAEAAAAGRRVYNTLTPRVFQVAPADIDAAAAATSTAAAAGTSADSTTKLSMHTS